MMKEVQSYLLSVIGISFLISVAQALIPHGILKKCVIFVCGLLLILTAIKPIQKIDLPILAQSISRMQVKESETYSGIEMENEKLISGIIKEKSETYIWDKATEIGINPLAIEVEVTTDASYPYPESVIIRGEYTQQQKQQLSEWIERELAIGIEHQEWLWNESQANG